MDWTSELRDMAQKFSAAFQSTNARQRLLLLALGLLVFMLATDSLAQLTRPRIIVIADGKRSENGS